MPSFDPGSLHARLPLPRLRYEIPEAAMLLGMSERGLLRFLDQRQDSFPRTYERKGAQRVRVLLRDELYKILALRIYQGERPRREA